MRINRMRSPATPEVPAALGFFKITLDRENGIFVSSWDIRRATKDGVRAGEKAENFIADHPVVTRDSCKKLLLQFRRR
jgi:hypothetical protein